MVCHNCGREIQLIGKVGRKDECSYCNADMHVCKNCRFFDPSKNNQCSEPQADYVPQKAKANFCEFFAPNTRVPLTSRSARPATDDARKAFDNLFKKK
jgi:ribosome-binding protein aMBF1 (putative translation factor)